MSPFPFPNKVTGEIIDKITEASPFLGFRTVGCFPYIIKGGIEIISSREDPVHVGTWRFRVSLKRRSG